MNNYIGELIKRDNERIKEEAYLIERDRSEIFNELNEINEISFYKTTSYLNLKRIIRTLDKIVLEVEKEYYEWLEYLDRENGYECITGLEAEDYSDYDEESDESQSLIMEAYDMVDELEYRLKEIINMRNVIYNNVKRIFNFKNFRKIK